MPQTRDSIADVWGDRTPFSPGEPWPERVDEHVEEEPDRWVQSCCVLCSNGCGCDIAVKDGRIVGVRGRADDHVNHGRMGPKGLHAWVANHATDRLTHPLIRTGPKHPQDSLTGRGQFREASWDEAMELIVSRSKELIDHYTGDTIAFYNSGQLFIEDYYTLSVMAHAGVRTNNIDGSTRLCTATAAQALHESFGMDGQPAAYSDVDVADCLLLAGHNVSNTQTVLWARMLDRLHGPNRPRLIVIDPRRTQTAQEADVHLANRAGTNVALCNGLLHLLIKNGHTDHDFIAKHTVGFEQLAAIVERYVPTHTEQITQVPAARIEEAADVIGHTPRLLSTVLQGFYQSHQATAAAVQINNINLIRGMIGRPGCGILQMNGQPTAQNTRETGCDGEYAGFRSWQNPEHMRDLARVLNVKVTDIPHWSTKSHIMETMRHAELGSVRMIWIIATNPAVSLPELHRIRKILAQERLFVVVQDGFMTETARLADVVLPAAIWGEKTGTFTNADRTVHISPKAVDPPGEARADMDIFLDYARRMGFKDKDDQPLIKWDTPEGAFEGWKACSKGRFCDYSGMTYAKLSQTSGIRWPCNEEAPDGTERLYTDLVFKTAADVCETFGHDLQTGADSDGDKYIANDPAGRALLRGAHYTPPAEAPDDTYPFWLTTGRVIYHFHTRTKTGRSSALNKGAGNPFAEINEQDAAALGIEHGDDVSVTSRRGTITVKAKVVGGDAILKGHVFVPFHYGYWDRTSDDKRAANELTLTAYDPVSKQPVFKYAAVAVHKAGQAPAAARVTETMGQLANRGKEMADKLLASAHEERSHVSDYVALVLESHEQFIEACDEVSRHHFQETSLRGELARLQELSLDCLDQLRPFADQYGQTKSGEPHKLRTTLFPSLRAGAFGLLRDVHDLFVMIAQVEASQLALTQAARGLGDEAMIHACECAYEQIDRQRSWILTQLKHRAPHTLVVPQ